MDDERSFAASHKVITGIDWHRLAPTGIDKGSSDPLTIHARIQTTIAQHNTTSTPSTFPSLFGWSNVHPLPSSVFTNLNQL